MRPEDVRSILATDCGSTTTKAILIERQENLQLYLIDLYGLPVTMRFEVVFRLHA